jgi:hypothetical protein
VISIPATPVVTPYWFELVVDASERSSVERFCHTSNDCEPLSRDVMEEDPESIHMAGQCEPSIAFISTFAVEMELRAKNPRGSPTMLSSA